MLSYSQWIGELPQWESYHNPNPPVKVVSLEDAQVTDFFTNRSRVLLLAEHHSLGADTHLAWDEYPLEIQCSRCFWWVQQSLRLMPSWKSTDTLVGRISPLVIKASGRT